MGRFLAFCCLFTLPSAAHAAKVEASPADLGKLVVMVNDRTYSPKIVSLHGTPDEPRVGDVMVLGSLPLVIGDEPEYRFRFMPR